MAITGKIRLIAQIAGMNSGGVKTVDLTGSDLSANAQLISLILASGANTIAVPVNSSFAIITFDPASVTTKTLKGVTGDTGVALNPIGFNLLNFNPASPPASFVITSSALDTGLYTEIIFA